MRHRRKLRRRKGKAEMQSSWISGENLMHAVGESGRKSGLMVEFYGTTKRSEIEKCAGNENK